MPATANGKFQYTVTEFKNHMKSKIQFFHPEKLYIGEDFAVFQFEFLYQHDNAYGGVLHWADTYNYWIGTDGAQRMVIRNRHKQEEDDK